jgi:uncharacterized protein (TIGR02271 family)
MAKTAVALYDSKQEAQQVVNELSSQGFNRGSIQLKSKSDRDALDTLTNAGLPHRSATAYQEGIKRGGHLVVVTTDDNQIDTAVDIMERYQSIDLNERAELWRSEGWSDSGTSNQSRRSNGDGETTIPVVEEELRVGKRQVESGGVRVNTHIVEEPVEETVNLHEEHVEVQRRPVNRAATAADFDTFEEGTMEFTESREEAVVEKQAHVAEEVVIRKDQRDRQQTVRDTVRHTEVEVDRVGSGMSNQRDFASYREGFRQDYDSRYASSGVGYEVYEPAYQYGYTLRSSNDMRGRSWKDVEAQARTQWEQDHRGTWDRFKDAVRHGWESVSQ